MSTPAPRLSFGRRTRLALAAAIALVILWTPVFECPAPPHRREPAGRCSVCRGDGLVSGIRYLRHEADRKPPARKRSIEIPTT